MTYYEDLTKAFDIALMEFGASNGIKICLENIDAPTSTATPYLASFMLLAKTEQADLGFNEKRAGIYQIDINYASSKGSAPVNKMAGLLDYAFRSGTTRTRNNICAEVQSVSLGPLIVQNGWATRPLSIDFIAFTERL